MLDHLNELLLDESLPVVHEDVQCLETGTKSTRIGRMHKMRNGFLLDPDLWCSLSEPDVFQVDINSSATTSGTMSGGDKRQPDSVSHRGEEATITVELEECEIGVESTPESGEKEIWSRRAVKESALTQPIGGLATRWR